MSSPRSDWRVRTVWTCLAWTCLSLCQACYDHRITQAIMERRQRAKAAEGAKLRATASQHAASAGSQARVGRVRVYVSEGYREQHGDWQKSVHHLVSGASDLLGPGFGVRLEVASIAEWKPACEASRIEAQGAAREQDIGRCLDELMALDAGEDGDWIVGMLGAFSRFTTSFDELGVAQIPGRHLVLRDVSDLAEHDAIGQAFASFTPSRRDEIYQRRKTHKRLAVFLHEWGHTLGALHTGAADSVLHAQYNDRMETYDAANQGIISAALRDLFRYAGKHEELLAYLRSTNDGDWLPGERDGLLASLERAAREEAAKPAPTGGGTAFAGGEPTAVGGEGDGPATAPHPFVVRGDEATLLADIATADRPLYREAVRLAEAEDSVSAWHLLAPLSERYQTSYAVQHLACGLAMQTGQHGSAQAVCARVSSLHR